MFKIHTKEKKTEDSMKNPPKKRRGWRVFFVAVVAVVLLAASYGAYIYASGKRIFDASNLTGSPFLKSLLGEDYNLKGEGDGRINILAMGKGGEGHPGGTLTDSIMVISIDPNEKTYAMLSIPRDLYVPIYGTKQYSKINEIYQYGENQKEGSGAALIKNTVGNILDLPIHYYLTIDFYGFKQFIDKIGGVDVNVDKAIYDPLYPADDMKNYKTFSIKAGQQHLDGATALKYARSRETSSDFDRAARQQKLVDAVRTKLLSTSTLANPKTILSLVNIVGDHVRTDFAPDELYALGKLVMELDGSRSVSKVLSNATDGELVSDSSTGTYALKPKETDWSGVQKVAHEIFADPNLEEEDAKIEVLNGTSISGLANSLGDTLESYNYNVISVKNATDRYAKTVIYDYSSGRKSVTLQFLKNRLNAEVIAKKSTSDSVDITVVIGDNYKGFTNNP
jgi:LCP family protein required for cell wall assembly